MEYYSAMRNGDILPFAITWIDLEQTMLIKIDKDKYYMRSLICQN